MWQPFAYENIFKNLKRNNDLNETKASKNIINFNIQKELQIFPFD